ncbi:MFS transporter [Microbulbifer hydrolyticus]|uniref:MFS family permease n=1 Tax=Microbulbifer hydrolyticus TaxID=48074 RepID=A0A6P1TEZ3_9GAMM|nr:MFS transporter [Microbulbifer hydrolyticus]MBB5213063.1 MFS family permease [Microbulbifer hydrolyticus]QHQ40421.1 YbfB/YjiJ family MFS transporter [Microbulbifer hydrolyticus]
MQNPARSAATEAPDSGYSGGDSLKPAAPVGLLVSNGWLASIFLAFLSSAGLYYVNIFPVIVDALMAGAGLSAEQAGQITFSNTMGAVIGAFTVSWLIRHIPRWKRAAAILLCCSIGMDVLTIQLANLDLLIPLRLVHGMLGGALVGLGFAVIARSGIAGRSYSMVLLVQYIGGFFGVRFLPALVAEHGTYVPFYALITFSTLTLLMLPLIANYPLPTAEESRVQAENRVPLPMLPFAVTLLALFCFQFANMALFAFIFDLGRSFDLPQSFISLTVSWASLIAIGGAALAAFTGQKLPLAKPLAIALVITLVGLMLFVFSNIRPVFILANVVTGMTWAFCVPYFLTMASRFDSAGQMGAFGGFASKLGLACGPLVAGYFITGGGSYTQLIIVATAVLAVCLAAVPAAARLDR